MPHALIVEDHSGTLSSLSDLIERDGFSTSRAQTLLGARQHLAERSPDIVLLDVHLPDGAGVSLLDALPPDTSPTVVLMTGQASLEGVVDALRRGVSDYLVKPIEYGRLKDILSQVWQGRAPDAGTPPPPEAASFGEMVGTHPRMREIYDQIARVAPTNATVLIAGESGTGKDVAARTIHALSRRRHGPYVALNCGAVSSTLIESELFGHERGSFTGADRLHRGVFERATGGTLFLDEVTEMPIELQARLLRVLETGSFTRTGGETPVPLDVRFLASTNRKPEEAVKDGRLREDLYYRLKVFQLALPPVRERPEDIATLSEHFLRQIGAAEGTVRRLAPETLRVLQAHAWPGNVRELRNTMYSAYILSRDEITPADLPQEVRACRVSEPLVDRPLAVNVGMTLAEAEERLIAATLSHLHGSKLKAAKMLGVSLKTLYNRVQQYSVS